MTNELGLFSLGLAMLVALTQAIVPMAGAWKRNVRMMAFGNSAALVQLALIALSFACLVWAFATSDFSVRVVAANSYTAKPLFYKVTATWGQHEGSMLLWILVLAIFGAAVAAFGRDLPATLKARVLSIQGLIGAVFLAFLIFTSNPFARLDPAPLQGMGFNPLLQDPGLAFHPPMLYLGYVGFSMAYSFSVAALIEGKVDAAWARWVRPWVLAAWCFLTIGITLGSLWAYYELGWGGWWYWDPVENASFMPWLIGTALLHSAIVVERRHGLVNWTLLLSILTFTLSLVGTFLVRSGVLTSVHAFAVDPARGVFILAMILGASGGALALYAFRSRAIAAGPPFAPISREGGILGNNLLLLCATATVFLGTFYPLIIDALTHDKISVGPPYFNIAFAPIMAVVAVLMAFGPMLRWRSDTPREAARPLLVPLGLGAVIAVSVGVIGRSWVAGVGFGLSSLILSSLVVWFATRTRIFSVPTSQSIFLARAFPGATWGFMIAHAGLAIAIIGVTAMSAWPTEAIKTLQVGATAELAPYAFRLDKVDVVPGPNYSAQRLTFNVLRHGKPDGSISTERRFYPERETTTTEAGIRPGLFRNLYIAYGEAGEAGGYTVRFNLHPFAMWIWVGGFTIAAGGFMSLADRRFRVGAPHRARASAGAAPVAG